MEKVISQYTTALDELNVLTEASYKLADDKNLTSRVSQIVDDVLSFLIHAYTLGMEHASIMLAYELSVDVDKMRDAIYKMIEGKTFVDRVIDHILAGDLSGLRTLVESEFHRVYNTAVQDGGQEFVDNGNFGVTKNWYTVKDDRVRETHKYLEGESIPLEEEFFTFDGDHAPYPGGFTRAENNVNCRCIVQLVTDE